MLRVLLLLHTGARRGHRLLEQPVFAGGGLGIELAGLHLYPKSVSWGKLHLVGGGNVSAGEAPPGRRGKCENTTSPEATLKILVSVASSPMRGTGVSTRPGYPRVGRSRSRQLRFSRTPGSAPRRVGFSHPTVAKFPHANLVALLRGNVVRVKIRWKSVRNRPEFLIPSSSKIFPPGRPPLHARHLSQGQNH